MMDDNTKLYIIAGVITLFVIALYFFFGNNKLNTSSWMSGAKESYDECEKIFGQPQTIVAENRQRAKWSNKQVTDAGYNFYRITVENIAVPHCCPLPHTDSVIASLKVDIEDGGKLLAILGTSKGFWYDQGRRMLYARCCCLGTVLAHFVFATTVLRSDLNAIISSYSSNLNSNLLLQSYTDLFSSVYNPKLSGDMDTYHKVCQELNQKLGENLGHLTYTPHSQCQEIDCSNALNYTTLNPEIANTLLCTPGVKETVSLNITKPSANIQEGFCSCAPTAKIPQTKGMDGYYTGGVPEDGKMYNLGLRREFRKCTGRCNQMALF